MSQNEGRRKKEEDRCEGGRGKSEQGLRLEGRRPCRAIGKSQVSRSPAIAVNPLLIGSQPDFPVCQFRNEN
ncbi:MAG: hypothetical protein JGK17_18245 [Microcoleus sp. PH2017_10_PVI_O_A]|uniref:hypothetical protein n=1 Tax=unclassified Microcoleus TaxID=2642155 RepID=UPI001D94B114|nr:MULTISPECIES: hypothetical protein [unclassified Microcoleus]MCC3407494.1 hypothetical protein [Microcoleus sp. PH2017_10_PVI_O_A]MCC3461562.1 hypothetical protein [Microcoleus sp. PH2017_11_PCY_U_A]MCC3480049.1 hypothetical protein [Microcoleus sp. PH2017_12_PCY_D_A]MCC3560897.1 hypothetical protein [Microcoleus sp. PH2017_27_LUM_O_A]